VLQSGQPDLAGGLIPGCSGSASGVRAQIQSTYVAAPEGTDESILM
jgi:hypothetical protein